MDEWPVYKKFSTISPNEIAECLTGRDFEAEGLRVRMDQYVRYAAQNSDEAPLYVFDSEFASKPGIASQYDIPHYFKEDLFSVFGSMRPDYRWLIVGGPRSGSTFHLDPNATSAWNAVLKGTKKWIMCPPGSIPPGVFVSADQSEVTAPLSVSEWLLNWYKGLKKTCEGAIEGICHEGEIMYIPSGKLIVLMC